MSSEMKAAHELSKTDAATFDKKAEQFFKSHRELPNGRDFRFNSQFDKSANTAFRDNFDSIFPNAPGVGF